MKTPVEKDFHDPRKNENKHTISLYGHTIPLGIRQTVVDPVTRDMPLMSLVLA